MDNLLAIDIGGTSIKYAIWHNNELGEIHSFSTPKTREEFYNELGRIVNKARLEFEITGVAISSPGAVNKQLGVIEGASAIPYIHNYPIKEELTELFGLPVSIENDANCAALAELVAGVGTGYDSLALFVIGTGVGGALIFNKKIWHGAHLHGGEFGFMKTKYGDILSNMASPVAMANRYNKQKGTNYNGEKVWKLADQGDETAVSERDILLDSLTEAIYDVQHSFDPELILLGGAISNNKDLVPMIMTRLQKISAESKIPVLMPNVQSCTLHSKANLRGAVADFLSSK